MPLLRSVVFFPAAAFAPAAAGISLGSTHARAAPTRSTRLRARALRPGSWRTCLWAAAFPRARQVRVAQSHMPPQTQYCWKLLEASGRVVVFYKIILSFCVAPLFCTAGCLSVNCMAYILLSDVPSVLIHCGVLVLLYILQGGTWRATRRFGRAAL